MAWFARSALRACFPNASRQRRDVRIFHGGSCFVNRGWKSVFSSVEAYEATGFQPTEKAAGLKPKVSELWYGAIALFLPDVPKAGQRPRLQVFRSEREYNSLLFIEVIARRRHRRQQKKTGLLQVLHHLRLLQIVVDFLVFLVEDFAVADLFQAMLQGLNQQFFLRARVSGEQ